MSAPANPAAGLGLPFVAAVSLGLAPFAPEPHIVGKLRWVRGGGDGMAGMDWLDLTFHGAPWLWLGGALIAAAWRWQQATQRS